MAYLMACFVQILKMTFRKKTFLYFVISYVSYFTMACAFNYGFVALKFTMDGRDRKKNRKEVNDQGSVECEFQPNQYPWLCQAIYLPNTPQHHRDTSLSTETYTSISRLPMYLSLLCQSPMTGFSCDCSRLKVSQATALYIAPMVSLLAITLVFEY